MNGRSGEYMYVCIHVLMNQVKQEENCSCSINLEIPIGWMVSAGRVEAATCLEKNIISITASPVADSHLRSRSSSSIIDLSCSSTRREPPFLKLLMPPSRVGPCSHPGIDSSALAGLIDAGSTVVATTRVAILNWPVGTIFLLCEIELLYPRKKKTLAAFLKSIHPHGTYIYTQN